MGSNLKKRDEVRKAETSGNIDKSKILVSFRMERETLKKLRIIANRKKSTKTKVISQLIELAYSGLYSEKGKTVNRILTEIIKASLQERKKAQ